MFGKTLLIKRFESIEYILAELYGKLVLGINHRRNKYNALNEVRGPYKYIEELIEDLENTDYPEREKLIWILNVKPELAKWKYPKHTVLTVYRNKLKIEVRRVYKGYILVVNDDIVLHARGIAELLESVKSDPTLRSFHPVISKSLKMRMLI